MAGSHLARLRDIVAQRPTTASVPRRELTYVPVDRDGLPLDQRLDGVRVEGAQTCVNEHGTCLRLDTVFEADRSHGRMRVHECGVPVDGCLDVLAGRVLAADPGARVVYVDLETTGLSGGAGTVPFMVGAGEWTAHGFVTTQWLMPGFASERAVLHAVNAHLAGASLIVTFNGRTFDIPVMEMRGELHRMPQRVCALPHLDMLPAARRLWRMSEDGERSCRLTHLEESVLGVGRVGDVPGFEIPGRYFEFVRGGGGWLLEPVLLHNRLDLLSLAALTARAQHLVREGEEVPPRGAEAWGLGLLYERAGSIDAAIRCFRQVMTDSFQCLEARRSGARALARLLRRRRRYEEAAAVWTMVLELGGRPHHLREAREALAIHHEHRMRNFTEARRYAEAGAAQAIGRAEREAFGRRLERIARKDRSLQAPTRPLWADETSLG